MQAKANAVSQKLQSKITPFQNYDNVDSRKEPLSTLKRNTEEAI